MNTAEQNFRLLQEIEANRRFLLMAYEQNPNLLASAEPRIRQLFQMTNPVVQEVARTASAAKQRGISLIELIMFIVIISTALVGILLVMNQVTRHSADPLIHKQSLAIAESLLEEVELMPFTICDPDDPNAASAVISGDCTGGAGGANDESKLPLGPEGAGSVGGAEGRYATPRFDNVNDYNGLTMAKGAVFDINNGSAVPGYGANVVVAQTALNGIPAVASLLVTVTVTGPDNLPIVLQGYRTRYSPNSLP